MKKILLPATGLVLSLTIYASAATSKVPPETDDAKFVRLTNQLEKDPLGDSDKSIRTWLLEWAEKSEDVTVTVCDILGPIPSQDVPYGPELLTQSIFGNAAFQISHVDQRSDMVATQLAGVRSSLRAYSAIVAQHSEVRIPYFDDLLSKESGGSLEAFMAPKIAEKCKQ